MIDTALYFASWFCIVTGAFFGITGALGLFRFNDFYARIHAASVVDTMCIGLILLGFILQSSDVLMVLKLMLLLLTLAYTAPTATHILAKTARREGLKPFLDEEKKGEKS